MSSKTENKGSKIGAWISAMRLRTLPLSFSVILMGSALAYSAQYATYQYSWLTFSLILITTLLLQILSNLANDYGDAKKGADNDGRIGPERAIQSGVISPQEMFKGIIITSLLALISGVWLLLEAFDYNLNGTFILFIVLGLASIAAAIKYTVGKRAYGYSGLGDLFVFIFFGLVGVIGTFYLQTKMLAWPVIFPAITMGCLSVVVLNLNNMRDQKNDQKVGKNTLVVKLGFAKSKSYHYTLFLIAYLVFPIPILFSVIMGGDFRFFLPFIPISLIHVIHIRKVIKVQDPKDFDPELKKIALSAFLLSVLFFAMILTVF